MSIPSPRPLTADEQQHLKSAFRSASEITHTTTLPVHLLLASSQVPRQKLWDALCEFHDAGATDALTELCKSITWGPRDKKPYGDCVDIAVHLVNQLPSLLQIIGSPWHVCVRTHPSVEFLLLDLFFLRNPERLEVLTTGDRPRKPGTIFWIAGEEIGYDIMGLRRLMYDDPPLDKVSASLATRDKHFVNFPDDSQIRLVVSARNVVFTRETEDAGTSQRTILVHGRQDVELVMGLAEEWLALWKAGELGLSVKFLLAMMLQGCEREALRLQLVPTGNQCEIECD